jgi:putative hydrolase of the HAD superfamily
VPGIDAVLYDFGGVFTLSPFTAAREGGAKHGLDMELAFELCFGPYHEDTDHPWHRLERGELAFNDARTALAQLAAERGYDVDPITLLAGVVGEDKQRDDVVARARAVRATGVRTAVVTNNVAEFGDGWRSLVPIDELFDVIVDSCQEGIRKPDPRIFHLALERLGTTAERSVFLDDHPANITAAEAVGITGILVGDDRVAAFDELDALLG